MVLRGVIYEKWFWILEPDEIKEVHLTEEINGFIFWLDRKFVKWFDEEDKGEEENNDVRTIAIDFTVKCAKEIEDKLPELREALKKELDELDAQ